MLEAFGCHFHHLGLACLDLDAEAAPWLALNYRQEGPDFEDALQRVRGRFLIGSGPRLELVCPLTPVAPITGTIARGTKLYHQGFTTTHLDEAMEALRSIGAKRMAAPAPAVAFAGSRIAFLVLPNMNLIELIEAPPQAIGGQTAGVAPPAPSMHSPPARA